MGLFYAETKVGFADIAHTIYPGQRVATGGTMTVAQMLSHFLDFWKTEARLPVELGNICEGAGYLWLAPITLLMPWSVAATRRIKLANQCLWLAFLLLAAWMLLPIPAAVGAFILFDKVLPSRCLPALGLINIAIVVTFVSTLRPAHARVPLVQKDDLRVFIGIFVVLLIALACMNFVYHQFFSYLEIGTAAAYTAFLAFCLRKHWRRLLAAALLLPAFATTALVNPIDRGLDVILNSSLSAAIKRQPELREGRWLVLSSGVALGGFFSASGLDLFNGLKIIPPLAELTLFDPAGAYASFFNRSCYLVAQVQTGTGPGEFDNPNPGMVVWKVNPLDPKLKEIGIRYLAFDSPPDLSIRQKLKLLFKDESSRIWAYELL